jgi:hypothetical protein
LQSSLRLFAFERRWLAAVFACVIPGSAAVPMSAFIDDLVTHAPLRVIAGARACLWLLLFAPPFVIGRLRTWIGLGARERLEVLERMRGSDLYIVRELPLLFKMLAALGYCGLPEVHARLELSPRDSSPPDWYPE